MRNPVHSTHASRRGSAAPTRRQFCLAASGTVAAWTFGAACLANAPQQRDADAAGRIAARPRPGLVPRGGGTRPLGLAEPRDALLQLPPTATTAALPLLLLLHGAGGSAAGILRRLGGAASAAGLAVLAPDSRESTWDGVRGALGPDVAFINSALDRVFRSVAIDPARVSIGGFSDGASYALSLGLMNGDLFRRVVAFSPGFVIEAARHGRPEVFISHGTRDEILPVARCSRAIVPRLHARGYQVTYREFEGGHTVPAEIAREGLQWATGTPDV
jgi:phospholipase/carboxylesterase